MNFLAELKRDEQALLPEALQLARDQHHPMYDAIHAVIARRFGATQLSFDRRLNVLCIAASITCDLLISPHPS